LRPTQLFPTLDRAISYYKRNAKPRSDKESRMQDIRHLRELGFRLMAQSQRGTAAMRHGNQYRDGLAIVMLTAMPLRISNLGALDLVHGIRRVGDRYSIYVPRSKNGDAIMFDLPIWLTHPIDVYLEQHRPYHLARRGRWWSSTPNCTFWVSSNGTAMTARQLSKRIVDRTREVFGKSVNPHLFRDIVATTIATEDPEHVDMILSILGHRSLKTSEKHYNHAKSLDASRRYQEALQDFRKPVGG
jgi:integrase/recombinase XerD